jgi:hypothetical protein
MSISLFFYGQSYLLPSGNVCLDSFDAWWLKERIVVYRLRCVFLHQRQIRNDQRPFIVTDVRWVWLANRSSRHPTLLDPPFAKVHNTL